MEVTAAGGKIVPRALSPAGKGCANPRGLGSFLEDNCILPTYLPQMLHVPPASFSLCQKHHRPLAENLTPATWLSPV